MKDFPDQKSDLHWRRSGRTQHMIKIIPTPSLFPFLSTKRGESQEIVFPHWFLESETSRLPRPYDAPPPAAAVCRRAAESRLSSAHRSSGVLEAAHKGLEDGVKRGNKVFPPPPVTKPSVCGSPKQKRGLIRKKAFQRGRSQSLVKNKRSRQTAQNWCASSNSSLNLRSESAAWPAFTSSTSSVVPDCHLKVAPLWVNRLHVERSIVFSHGLLNTNECCLKMMIRAHTLLMYIIPSWLTCQSNWLHPLDNDWSKQQYIS